MRQTYYSAGGRFVFSFLALAYGDLGRHSRSLFGTLARPRRARAILIGLAALLVAPPVAMAQTCTPTGAGTLPTATYDGASYDNGIVCTGMKGGLTLTVAPPEGGTTIKSEEHGIHVKDTKREPGAISVNIGAGVKIGTQENPIGETGINVTIQGSPTLANTAKISIDNAGSIRTKKSGIKVDRYSPGDVTVTNSGTIVSENPDDSVKEIGILVHTRKQGHVVIDHSGSVTSGWHAAIYAWHEREVAAADGSIKITSSGTVRSMVKHGILAEVRNNNASVPATVTVTGGTIHGKDDGIRVANKGNGSSTVRVSGTPVIKSTSEDGIHASAGEETNNDKSKAAVVVEFGAGAQVTTMGEDVPSDDSSHGILAEHWGNQALAGEETDTGSITINSAGAIRTAGSGHGIAAFAYGTSATVPITVNVSGGSMTAAGHGIHVENKGIGKIAVTVDEGAMVTAKMDGVHVDGAGTFAAGHATRAGERTQMVTIRGMVTGGSGEYAGVHMVEGGTLVIGPRAQVSAQSGVAIKANAAGDLVIVLETDKDGLVGNLDGRILNDKMTTFQTRHVDDAGTETTLAMGSMVNMRGETQGVYDEVHRAKLMTSMGGHEFEKQTTRRYHDRARVYEALPSVLLDLNGQTPYRDRMAAPRDGNGVWARFAAGDGERRPASATTARGFTGQALAWDLSQYGIEAGLDFPIDNERLLFGLSLHARQGEATVAHGGTIDVTGFGGGISTTYRDEAGFYLDGRVSYTYFNDVDLTSRTRGAVQSDLSGNGYALGLEAGKAWSWRDSVALTPRARFVWSSVDLDDFADLAGIAGSGRVALETATSLKGRLGLLAETVVGAATLKDRAGDGGRLFGSLDVEHEFAVDRETMASGTALASEVRATWGRVGLGGAFSWNDGLTTLSGEGFYATAGSDNTDFGGSLALTFRF